MEKPKPETRNIINKVTKIRENNNILWMNILSLAIQTSPKTTREFIKMIGDNDKEITKWLGKL